MMLLGKMKGYNIQSIKPFLNTSSKLALLNAPFTSTATDHATETAFNKEWY